MSLAPLLVIIGNEKCGKMRKNAKKDGRKRTDISLKIAGISAVFRLGSHISSLLLYFVKKLLTIFG